MGRTVCQRAKQEQQQKQPVSPTVSRQRKGRGWAKAPSIIRTQETQKRPDFLRHSHRALGSLKQWMSCSAYSFKSAFADGRAGQRETSRAEELSETVLWSRTVPQEVSGRHLRSPHKCEQARTCHPKSVHSPVSSHLRSQHTATQ